MFDLKKLYDILTETTAQLRKGEVVEEHTEKSGLHVKEINFMPHKDEAPAGLERVDVEFIEISVDKTKAEKRRAELIDILDHYPAPDRLAGGPSYIEVGAEIGDQGAAFQLFALGKVLGLWDVITPATMGFKGAEARSLAGSGFVMITGYKPASAAA